MIDPLGLGSMTDAGFVLTAYGVILGALAIYTVTLWRRLRNARRDDEAR